MIPEPRSLSSLAEGKPLGEEDSDVWNGFYKKPLQTRLDQLKLLYPDLSMKGLPSDIADSMIENCIGMPCLGLNLTFINAVGTFNLPMGLALNFQVNSKNVVIPMCVEEASVIGEWLSIYFSFY
jgi:hydroxymethylglutaryl-CoA reductase